MYFIQVNIHIYRQKLAQALLDHAKSARYETIILQTTAGEAEAHNKITKPQRTSKNIWIDNKRFNY